MENVFLIGPVLFVVIVSILERVTPNYNWKTDYVSELSLGKYGWIQKANFIFCGVCVTGLCLMLAKQSPDIAIKVGWYLGSLLGFVTISAGVWDTDPHGKTFSRNGKIQDKAYQIGMAGIGAAYFLIGWGYRSNPLVMAVSWGVAIFSWIWWQYGYKIGIPTGIAQRTVIYSALLWLVAMAVFIS